MNMDKPNSSNAPIQSIGEYFSQRERNLIIPPWQREYVWQVGESGEVGELLSDLREFAESKSTEYWLGSVILCEEPHGSKDYWLIDGQQRSLTLLIFIMAAKKYMVNHKLLVSGNENHARLLTLCSDSISAAPGGYIARVSMDRGKADSILQSIYFWSSVGDEIEKGSELLEEKDSWTQTQKNLANVADWIYGQFLETKKWVPDNKFVDYFDKIINNVKIVELHLPTIQDALTVFDRINNRGADLNSSDLIKNRIFQHSTDDDFTEISDNWRLMRKNLSSTSLTRLKDPTYLLRTLAIIRQGAEKNHSDETLKKGSKITYNELSKFWSDRLDPKQKSNPRILPIKSQDLVSEMLESSTWLAALSNEVVPHSKSHILKDLYFSRYLKIVQHYPMLLAGRQLSEESFALLARQVHARTAFYYLSGERTQDFEKMVPEWTFEISALPNTAKPADIRKIYENYEISEKAFSELEQSMQLWSYRDGTEKKKIRAVLSQLSRSLDGLCGKELRKSPEAYFETAKKGAKFGWDLDHVEARRSDPKDSIFHSIGNLVLLHPIDNRSKGKAKSVDKEANYSDCSLILTKTIVGIKANPDKKKVEKYLDSLKINYDFDLSTWSEKQIKLRTKFYFALLKDHLTIK
jgi:hypothetical protein